MRTKADVMNNDMESRKVITISEYRAAVIYSETEVQVRVFPKRMKQLTTVQNVITEKL